MFSNNPQRKTLASQQSKLEKRGEADLEVINELRSFMKEKAKIEEEYGKSLEKLARSYAGKKFRRGPALPKEALRTSTLKRDASLSSNMSGESGLSYQMEDGTPVREVYHVYLSIMQSTDRLAKSKLSESEKILTSISEVIKEHAKDKTIILKKTNEFLGKYHNDLNAAYEELEKAKSAYEKVAKETEKAQRQYNETSAKPNSGLNALRNMVTRIDGDERVEKLRLKWKDATNRLAEVRNEYILAIESTNSQQNLYYDVDLPKTLKDLDGDFHLTFKNAVEIFINLESSYSRTLKDEMTILEEAAAQVNSDKDVKTFLDSNATVFDFPGTLKFDSSSGDEIHDLVVDESTKEKLGQILSLLKSEEATLSATNPPTPAATLSPLEQDLETEGIKRILNLRKQRVASEIKILEDQGVQAVKVTSVQRTISREDPIDRKAKGNFVCVYSYSKRADGEISISEGDELERLEDENEGWIKVRNLKTYDIGLVPFDYIEASKSSDAVPPRSSVTLKNRVSVASSAASSRRVSVMPTPKANTSSSLDGEKGKYFPPLAIRAELIKAARALYDYKATCDGELSFKTGDIITITNKDTGSSAWWEGEGPTGRGQFPVNHVELISPPPAVSAVSATFSVKALYDYTAQDSGELSFKTGDYIKVLDSSDPDWWSGQFRSSKGLFPANYVERCYGEHPPNPNWPNGARIAICFVVNYEEGGENTPDNGDAGSEVYLNETPGGVPKKGRDMNMETQYEYGSRVGVWRILRMFAEKSWKFTCYAVGRAVELNPEPIKAMTKAGHEIASHNYRWIDYMTLDEETEREHVRKCVAAIKDASGKPPRGWYTGRVSPNSRQIVLEEYEKMGLELLYDCDAYNDELPYFLRDGKKEHLVIPYTLDINDMKFAVAPGFSAVDGYSQYLKYTFDVLYKEGGKFMNVGLHCRIVGKPGRAHGLQEFMDHGRDDEIHHYS
ncbi:hypothetical protein HDU97_000641 [Phlyctochytrium planicorne]|nr:hypothetical protein HDU97_000641 [Phlyctochytrium planicorne]